MRKARASDWQNEHQVKSATSKTNGAASIISYIDTLPKGGHKGSLRQGEKHPRKWQN